MAITAANLKPGMTLTVLEWNAIRLKWEANDKLAEMNGVASTHQVWYLEEGRKIVAVDGPSGGCGDSSHVKITVTSVGTEGEYPRVLADVVASITEECRLNWG